MLKHLNILSVAAISLLSFLVQIFVLSCGDGESNLTDADGDGEISELADTENSDAESDDDVLATCDTRCHLAVGGPDDEIPECESLGCAADGLCGKEVEGCEVRCRKFEIAPQSGDLTGNTYQFCEQQTNSKYEECSEAELRIAWPGPGYGIVKVGDMDCSAPVGWKYFYLDGLQETDSIIANAPAFTADKWSNATERVISEKNCSTIDNLDECINTWNPPTHCVPTLAIPFAELPASCDFDSIESGLWLKSQFVACRSVNESDWHLTDAEREAASYRGLIKNSSDGTCMFFEDFENAIPAGWNACECSDCSE